MELQRRGRVGPSTLKMEAAQLDEETLKSISASARIAFESLVGGRDEMFSAFPRGTCGVTTELIGRFLEEHYGQRGFYICGSNHLRMPRQQSHAWAEFGPFIVDLTHDQVADTGLTSWVLPVTSKWHAQFRRQTRREGFCTPAGWPMYPHRAYRVLQAHLLP